ncbi:MAG: ribosome biogenesis factor YjgA [Pseudomonadota bacterium]
MSEQDQTAEDQHRQTPSRSAKKREALALQGLGEQLVELSAKQLSKVPIEDERLRETIYQARSIKSHSAKRRHLQLIGKLMRDIDAEPIRLALDHMYEQRREQTDAFHSYEKLRDDVLAAGPDGVEMIMRRWPQADRQQLRQLLRQHAKESAADKPPAASRKLFRLIRELAGSPD